MQPCSYLDIIGRVRDLEQLADDEQAEVALSTVLSALAQLLDDETRRGLAAALPDSIAQYLRPDAQTARSAGTFRELSSMTHARGVCRALGEILTPSARAMLLQAEPELAESIEPPVYDPGHRPLGDPHDQSKRLRACGLKEEREARRTRPG